MQNKLIIYSYLFLFQRKFINLNFFVSFFLQYNSLYKLRLFTILNLMHYVDFTENFSKKVSNYSLKQKKRKKKLSKKKKFTFQLKRGFFSKKRRGNPGFNIILRLKRKNLFITSVYNKTGDILFKRNLGTCGFKKKVKFTGFALEHTSNFFMKKITLIWLRFLKRITKPMWVIHSKYRRFYNVYIEQYLRAVFFKTKDNVILSKQQRKFSIFDKKDVYFKLKSQKSYESKIQGGRLSPPLKGLKRRVTRMSAKQLTLLLRRYRATGNYRYHGYRKRIKRHHKHVTLVVKNNLKYWPFRYIMKGFFPIKKHKRFFCLNKISVRTPISHSLGFRLKKKRRV